VEDDDTTEEWEQLNDQLDFEEDGWAKKVDQTKPNVTIAGDIVEMRKLREEVKELKEILEKVLADAKDKK
jgi:hypothetical protein